MRKTRLVILPTKCLHQMGFLLLFLSCPVIGDWGRIRPESENLHRAIQVDREGTCGIQRDPPGGLLNFLNENGSDQCRLSEDFYLNTITKKPIFREIKSDERRVDLQSARQRNTREYERRDATDRRNVRRAVQNKVVDERRSTRRESQRRVIDERRVTRRESQRRLVDEKMNAKREPERRTVNERREIRRTLQRDHRKDVREHSQTRSRSPGSSRSSLRQPENEGPVRNQRLVLARNIRSDNGIEARNEREELRQTRPIVERRTERRLFREPTNERRENERRVRNAQETTERQAKERVFRSTEREKKDIRRDSRRSVPERTLRRRKNDMTVSQNRERSQERQTERLSLARKEQNKQTRRSESERNTESPESRLSQIRKTRSFENLDEAFKQKYRETRRSDVRRNTESRQSVNLFKRETERDPKEQRVEPLNDKVNRITEIKSKRINSLTKYQNPLEDVSVEKKNGKEGNIYGEITKWMDLKRFESLKVGDWTTNCIVGAVVYFLSTKQIKAI